MRQEIKPVRKIGKGKGSLRGLTYSKKNDTHRAFESSLERDFLEILEFDNNVESFCEQPVEILYLHEGKEHRYTPDVFVSYRKDLEISASMSSLLIEVKYRETLKEKWSEFKPKFKAAKAYAEKRGWKFKIITEKEIRTTYLSNIKFLLPYRKAKFVNTSDTELLLASIDELKETCPEELILFAARDRKKQAELLYCLWHLISFGIISCDLSQPLNMRTEIWQW